MTPARVDHSRDHALATLGNQAARAWALQHLLEDTNLPVISNWMIDAQLTGIAGVVLAEAGEGPEDQRRKVQAWAGFLHVQVSESTVCDAITLRAEGPTEYGFHVHISTHFRAAIREVAA